MRAEELAAMSEAGNHGVKMKKISVGILMKQPSKKFEQSDERNSREKVLLVRLYKRLCT